MKFFMLDSAHIVSEYVNIDNELYDIESNCRCSKIQLIPKEIPPVELKDESGDIWPDFMYESGLPLISKRFKDFLDDEKIENLFYKEITLKRVKKGDEKKYWLAIPPKIKCLGKGTVFHEVFGSVEHFEIDEKRIGYYNIFRCENVSNPEIILTESFAEKLKAQNFEGVILEPLP